LKPLILNLYDTVILLRNWIALMIPKIEDGNTFGVEVQENMLVQLRRKLLEAEAELLIW
jgi:proteasome activator subunit 3 (PA28 gamma)